MENFHIEFQQNLKGGSWHTRTSPFEALGHDGFIVNQSGIP